MSFRPTLLLALLPLLVASNVSLAQQYTLAPQRLPTTRLPESRPLVAALQSEQRIDSVGPSFTPHEELPPGNETIPAETTYSNDYDNYNFMPPPNEWHYGHYNDGIGPEIRIFEPKVRVFFDVGEERDGKLDIFHDGSLAPSINFLEIYWADHWPERLGHQDWRMGPIIGVGISSPAGSNGTAEATGAPVLMGSVGMQFEFILNQQTLDRLREEGATPSMLHKAWQEAPKAGIEIGFAGGVSSDETLDFKGDGAIYAGVTLHRGK